MPVLAQETPIKKRRFGSTESEMGESWGRRSINRILFNFA